MAAKKPLKEKEPAALGTQTGSDARINNSSNINSSTKTLENQGISCDLSETQVFQQDETQYQKPIDNQQKSTHWLFIVYPESAPADWKQQLEATGLTFAVSPLHDKDRNPDGSPKKPHYHVIVSYGQSQRYSAVIGLRDITHGPYPLKCGNVTGAYAYFTHAHNPEKAQYDKTGIERFNGWERALEAADVSRIKAELTLLCLREDIQEYGELIVETLDMDGDYQQVVMNNTVYFDRLVSSYRHAPLRVLYRYYGKVATDEERDAIKQRIAEIEAAEAEAKRQKGLM